MTWHALSDSLPGDGDVVFVAFHYQAKRWSSDPQRTVSLCMYTPSYIATWCREDEGQWKGMSSEDCRAAWAWCDSEPEYPEELEQLKREVKR